jgi:hypothetical protein
MTIQDQLTNLLTAPEFLAWSRTKDPAQIYLYTDGKVCPIATFLKENGIPVAYVCPDWVELEDDSKFSIPSELNRAVLCTHEDLNKSYWGVRAYGALAERLEELVRQQNQIAEKQAVA